MSNEEPDEKESNEEGEKIITRRTFLGMGLAGGLATFGAAFHGFAIEPRWLEVRQFDIPIPHLPAALEGFIIAHITDLHLRALGNLHDTLFEALHAHKPDLIAMTGDIIEDKDGLGIMEVFCRRATAVAPAIATLGNWEHLDSRLIPDVRRVYERCEIPLLVNEHCVVNDELVVVGIDDATRGKPRIGAALEGIPPAPANLLLTHSPILFDRWPTGFLPFDLGLAGHTHGGQIRLGSVAPVLPSGSGRFVAGFYHSPAGRVFVSRGLGTSKVPVRFMCRPELPFFRLVRD